MDPHAKDTVSTINTNWYSSVVYQKIWLKSWNVKMVVTYSQGKEGVRIVR